MKKKDRVNEQTNREESANKRNNSRSVRVISQYEYYPYLYPVDPNSKNGGNPGAARVVGQGYIPEVYRRSLIAENAGNPSNGGYPPVRIVGQGYIPKLYRQVMEEEARENEKKGE